MNDLETEEKVDVLVIGAGPSGTVAAAILHKNGFNVKIVEKQKFPRFVIGESLLPRSMYNFDKAGFIDTIEKAGFQKKYGAKFADKYEVCDFDFSSQFSDGWTWTWQVKRDRFDHILAEEVIKRGIALDYESEVTAVRFNEDGSSVTQVKKENHTSNIHARYIVDSSGYGRVLPRLLDLNEPSKLPERSSFFCHVKPKEVTSDKERMRIIIIVYTCDIWGWVIPFADGTSSIGIVGSPDGVHRYKGTKEEQMRKWIAEIPALQERFTDCEMVFEPRTITGYSSEVKKLYGNGYVLTGNALGFVDPIFSSGVTLATESGALAAELVTDQLDGKAVDWEKDYSEYIISGVDVFKTFVNAWYSGDLQKIFFSESPNEKIKQQICSVLAGYVWDNKNPFVKKHDRALSNLAKIVSS
ncbi:tryptophan 7-halogenase [Fulvivirga sp. 29W222]|uniref:Tryptophan 7-halogenase n=1 Tax=Fulvivirga marina TaxID=2494733 RepID=A0A937KB80_9BACT|nr:NAD(P)/FAD-dependent oxidoreductase [Fulvivirga marina]MBL6446536.1 tryptophan 7-halogenase [Fulvivirga marina]